MTTPLKDQTLTAVNFTATESALAIETAKVKLGESGYAIIWIDAAGVAKKRAILTAADSLFFVLNGDIKNTFTVSRSLPSLVALLEDDRYQAIEGLRRFLVGARVGFTFGVLPLENCYLAAIEAEAAQKEEAARKVAFDKLVAGRVQITKIAGTSSDKTAGGEVEDL